MKADGQPATSGPLEVQHYPECNDQCDSATGVHCLLADDEGEP